MNEISIIICCHNSSDRIITTLQHLQNQHIETHINWEVIVVDNASTDSTAEIAMKTWAENPVTEIKVVREDKPGLMYARHKGLEVAKYEIVSFIDDDNWVESFWVEKIFSIFSMDEKIGACGGSSEAVFESIKPDWFQTYENNFAVGHQANKTGYVENKNGALWGAGLSFKKSLWQELQNRKFKNLTIGREGNKITSGDDTELCYAFRLLGYRLYYMDELSLKHFMPADRMKFSYLEKINKSFGKAYSRLNCYKTLLYPGQFTFRTWWIEWAASVKKILKFSIILLFTSNTKKSNEAKFNRAYWRGYAAQIISDRGHLKIMTEEIKRVFLLS